MGAYEENPLHTDIPRHNAVLQARPSAGKNAWGENEKSGNLTVHVVTILVTRACRYDIVLIEIT